MVVVVEEFVFRTSFCYYGDIALFGLCFEFLFGYHPGTVAPDGEQEQGDKKVANDFSFHVDLTCVEYEIATAHDICVNKPWRILCV